MIDGLFILFALTVIGLIVGLVFALVLGSMRLAWQYSPQVIAIAVIFTIVYMVVN